MRGRQDSSMRCWTSRRRRVVFALATMQCFPGLLPLPLAQRDPSVEVSGHGVTLPAVPAGSGSSRMHWIPSRCRWGEQNTSTIFYKCSNLHLPAAEDTNSRCKIVTTCVFGSTRTFSTFSCDFYRYLAFVVTTNPS
ncbi:unnamed protein product [Amoebophrya sp. A120]|nr:unnamed protein product [Amoebophrya sp. A120]|eukprot:GSA120T00015686001.1